MARTSILIGYPASGTPVIISGPEIPIFEQRAVFKKLRGSYEHDTFTRVELWESGSGIVATAKFRAGESAVEVPPALESKPADPLAPKQFLLKRQQPGFTGADLSVPTPPDLPEAEDGPTLGLPPE